jgi:rhodanese-related sulfurtransferase
MRWYRLAILIAVGSAAGLAWNTVSGRGLPLTHNVYIKPGEEVVDVAEAKRRFDKGAVLFLDARPRMIYGLEHIPGALALPEDELATALPALEPHLRNRYDIVVYCSGFGCEASHIVARTLKEKGIPAVVLQDGMPAWQDAGYPIRQGLEP